MRAAIEIRRQKEAEYADEDGTFIFRIDTTSQPMQLHAHDWLDGSSNSILLTEAQRSRIIPRIAAHMDPWSRDVRVSLEDSS